LSTHYEGVHAKFWYDLEERDDLEDQGADRRRLTLKWSIKKGWGGRSGVV
jgi:hypothetical protein